MTEDETRAALEALIQAEADRAVKPYVGKAPPVVFRKLRELAERYYREHPQAFRILELQVKNQQLRSGETIKLTPDGEADTGSAPAAAARKA